MKCSLSEAVEQTILFINDPLQVSAHSQISRFFKAENKELNQLVLSQPRCIHIQTRVRPEAFRWPVFDQLSDRT